MLAKNKLRGQESEKEGWILRIRHLSKIYDEVLLEDSETSAFC
jgi:hypothetical protein